MACTTPAGQRLEKIASAIEYRDWKFEVIEDGADIFLRILFEDLDAYTGVLRPLSFIMQFHEHMLHDSGVPGFLQRALGSGYVVPIPKVWTDEQIAMSIGKFIYEEVLRHEWGEFFLFEGGRPFDPHKSEETDNRYPTLAGLPDF